MPRNVLLDVMVLAKNALTARLQIRKEFSKLNCQIIFQTTMDTGKDIHKSIWIQGYRYLIKPIRPSILKQHPDHWLVE